MERSDFVKYLTKFLKEKELIFLVEYGNKKGVDIDLFAVYKEAECSNFAVGKIDITRLNLNTYRELILLHDPVVTEPILGGTLLTGNQVLFKSEKKKIRKPSYNPSAVVHLLQKSFDTFSYAKIFLLYYEEKPTIYNLIGTLSNLSYSCSYYYFARHYTQEKNVLTFKKLLSCTPVLKNIVATLKDVKHNKKMMSVKDIRQLHENWQNFLIFHNGENI